jgi:hypothetical protein
MHPKVEAQADFISHPFPEAENPNASFPERMGHPERYREGQKRRETWATRQWCGSWKKDTSILKHADAGNFNEAPPPVIVSFSKWRAAMPPTSPYCAKSRCLCVRGSSVR